MYSSTGTYHQLKCQGGTQTSPPMLVRLSPPAVAGVLPLLLPAAAAAPPLSPCWTPPQAGAEWQQEPHCRQTGMAANTYQHSAHK